MDTTLLVIFLPFSLYEILHAALPSCSAPLSPRATRVTSVQWPIEQSKLGQAVLVYFFQFRKPAPEVYWCIFLRRRKSLSVQVWKRCIATLIWCAEATRVAHGGGVLHLYVAWSCASVATRQDSRAFANSCKAHANNELQS